jgi:hypothetical protein
VSGSTAAGVVGEVVGVPGLDDRERREDAAAGLVLKGGGVAVESCRRCSSAQLSTDHLFALVVLDIRSSAVTKTKSTREAIFSRVKARLIWPCHRFLIVYQENKS